MAPRRGGDQRGLKAKFGGDIEKLPLQKLPLGAVGIYTASQKIRTGLQQLMAGSRSFNLSTRPLLGALPG